MPALSLLAAVAVASGCGSGSKATRTKAALTKAEYVEQANGVCEGLEARLRTLAEAGNLTTTELLRESLRAKEQADARLLAIPLPAPSTIPSEWLHYRQLALREARKFLPANRSSQAMSTVNRNYFLANKRAREIAESYGLTSCLKFAAT